MYQLEQRGFICIDWMREHHSKCQLKFYRTEPTSRERKEKPMAIYCHCLLPVHTQGSFITLPFNNQEVWYTLSYCRIPDIIRSIVNGRTAQRIRPKPSKCVTFDGEFISHTYLLKIKNDFNPQRLVIVPLDRYCTVSIERPGWGGEAAVRQKWKSHEVLTYYLHLYIKGIVKSMRPLPTIYI